MSSKTKKSEKKSKKTSSLEHIQEGQSREQSKEQDAKHMDQTDQTVHTVHTEQPKKKTAGEELRETLERLSELKDEDLAKLPKDDILNMRKNLNPYGRVIAGSDKWLTFSLTQISHEYWKKFITTSMIGFLNRMCDEWKVPNGVPVVSVYDYLDDKTKLNTPQTVIDKDNKSSMYDYEFNRKWMEKRLVVKEFLEEVFQFNPDEHVRSAYKPNYADKNRNPINTMAARLAVAHLAAKDPKFRAEKALNEDVQASLVGKTKKVKKIIIGKDGKTKREVIREVPVVQPPKEAVSVPTPDKLNTEHPVDSNAAATVLNMIPPHDMFGRFKMYYTENYEQLRDAVKHLYCETPDLELAICPHAWHDSEKDAELFKKQHADEVIAEVFSVRSGMWNLFDSFKQQRESVNFYNKNTIVLEEIVKQIERDERLGQDLMAKRVTKEKEKNVIESGPDAENFKQWRKENNEIAKLGAKYIGDMADEDMPADSVQVDVWRLAKGGLELTKDKFYSKAEAPSFVKEAQDKVGLTANGLKGSASTQATN